METPEVWVTIRSLKLFLKYYKNPSKRVRLKRPLDPIEENEIRDYREFVSPAHVNIIHSQQFATMSPLASSSASPTIAIFLRS